MNFNVKMESYPVQLELYDKMKNGDSEARRRLIECCIPLAIKWANKFYRPNANYTQDELHSTALLALIKGVDKWNPAKSKLTTYVGHAIYNEICSFLAKSRFSVVSIGESTARKASKNSNHPANQVRNISFLNNKDGTLDKDVVFGQLSYIKEFYTHDPLPNIFQYLNEEETELICARFGIKTEKLFTQDQIKERFGFGKANFHKRCKEIIKKIRLQINDCPVS